MEHRNWRIVDAILKLMLGWIHIWIENLELCFFVFMEDFVLHEQKKWHIISVFNISRNDFSLWSFHRCIAKLTFNFIRIIFCYFGRFSFNNDISETLKISRIMSQKSIIISQAFINNSKIISLHFEENSFQNVFRWLLSWIL